MDYTIGEAAALAGVSVRTLRYYDEIGLLSPSAVAESGYRYYNEEALGRLQEILFFRGLGFSLSEIGRILDKDDYDRDFVLSRQKELLLAKRRRVDELITLIEKTIGDTNMKHSIQNESDLKDRFAAEVKEKWGETPAYAQSKAKHAAYNEAQEAAIAAEADEIFVAFAGKMDEDPASPGVQELVAKWQGHISQYHYQCTKEILGCLGQMYVADQRFRENLDRFGDGNAAFMAKAIEIYCR